MSSWPPLVLAVAWLGASSACLAAEPRPADQPAAVAPATVDSERPLNLALSLGVLGSDASASSGEATPVAASLDHADGSAGELPMHFLNLHFGRADRPGRVPGDAHPLYGEVGINFDTPAGLALVPSYRVVVNEDDRADYHSRAIAGQVLKLGARIPF
jgi:hypothetical protein